jgi:hypothetical protein
VRRAGRIEFSSTLDGSDGPVEHVKMRCIAQHRFLMPRDMLKAPAPVDEASTSRATQAG